MSKTSKIISVISLIIVIVAGVYIYKTIYPPAVVLPQEVEAIKQEVIKDRIIIKEVIRNAKEQAVAAVEALSDDTVADELNVRLEQYRKRRSAPTE